MVLKTIDAALLKKAFLSAAKSIERKKEIINELNVFPVPDGDTGTNMSLTIMSAANDVARLSDPTMEQLAKAISNGSLCGARGNSGVILSQLFRGFTKEIRNTEAIDVPTLAAAFEKAVETAYKAVMKPKEGTILTVARGGAERAQELVQETDDIVVFGEEVLKKMEEVLAYTPELLPVLKEAGVVDSGGQGLLEIVKGAYDAILGKEIDFSVPVTAAPSATTARMSSTSDIKFGYCTEFIIYLEKEYTEKTEADFKAYLESIGDSIVVVSMDDVVKVHVHTNDPGNALQRALTYGSLSRIKIDNMREEHNEKLLKEMEGGVSAAEAVQEVPAEHKQYGFIAVSIGAGVNEIFTGLGVDCIIEGGQTMNPSTEDMLNAIAKINADNIFILPNNKNIILAAEQAMRMTKDKNIIVLPSKNVPQGIAALIGFVPEDDADVNTENMKEEMTRVKTGQVTYAVRDTSLNGVEIKQGNIMGIGDEGILSVGEQIEDTAFAMVEEMMDEDSELISIYYGEEIAEEAANGLADRIMEAYPDVDVELHFGGQPVYYYVVSVE